MQYTTLIAELPQRKIDNIPNQNKFNEILKNIDNTYFPGPESDGLNLSISAHNSRIRAEAMKYCNHEIVTKMNYTYTADARLLIIRTMSCSKCGLKIIDEKSEPVKEWV